MELKSVPAGGGYTESRNQPVSEERLPPVHGRVGRGT